MFQITLNSLSLIALVLAATATLVLFARARRVVAHSRSRRVECYYRDLKKIDEQEQSGKLDEAAAEEARTLLLKSSVSGSAPQQGAWDRFGEYKPVITSLLLTGVLLMGAMATNSFDTGQQRTGSTAGSSNLASFNLASVAMASDNTNQNPSAQKSEDDLASLQKYVKTIASGPTQFNFATMFSKTAGDTNQSAPMSKPPTLPDVDTMISRLAARLKKSPDDVEGWRMLGWSYFNTAKYEKSITAYKKALKLDPASASLQAALNEAKSKMLNPASGQAKADAATGSAGTASASSKDTMAKTDKDAGLNSKMKDKQTAQTKAGSRKGRGSGAGTQDAQDATNSDSGTKMAKGPSAQDIENSKSMMPADRQAMIMGMVNRLAARLEKSPRDAAGWQRLIHSRMVLGDKQAARKALTRALEIFAAEPKVKATITAAAQKSGVTVTTTN